MNITIDQSRCTGCGECVKDCPVGVLKTENHVACVVKPENCIKCQHCLAVCPGMAVIFNGIKAEDCFPAGPLPEPEKVINLLRMRRSIRRFSEKEVPPEILQELLSQLKYSPTGCNDHRLQFFLAEKRSDMITFRNEVNAALKKLVKSPLRFFLPKRYRKFLKVLTPESDLVFRNAPHLLLCATPKKAPCAKDDPTIALTQFEVLCQSYGIGCCWCGFGVRAFKYVKSLKKHLALDKNYQIGGVLLFGYPEVNYPRSTQPDEVKITRL